MYFHIALVAYLPLVLFTAVVDAATISHEARDARNILPSPPSKDPFYQPPSDFESSAPGTILRKRQIVPSLLDLIPDPVEAHQILYRTNSVNGSAIASVTTVFKPLFAKKDRIVSFQMAYDSSFVDCSPSYSVPLGASIQSNTNSLEFLFLHLWLLAGNVVVAPDYEGFEAAWLAGHLAGQGVLDSMRAVRAFGPSIGLVRDPMIAGVGYSGGGAATAWTAALHPTYAPDLNVKGWAIGGVPTNISAFVDLIDGTVFAGFLPTLIAGLSRPTAYEARLAPFLQASLTPVGSAAVKQTLKQCEFNNLVGFAFQSVKSTKFSTLGADLMHTEPLASVIDANALGANKTLTPSAPVLLYHSKDDEIVPQDPAEVTRDAWCTNGADISYINLASGGHLTAYLVAIPDVFHFVNNAFDGTVSQGCSQKTLYGNKLNPLALGLGLEPVLIAIVNWFGKIGVNDEGWIQSIKNGKPL